MKKILTLISIIVFSLFSYISKTFACSCTQLKPPLEAVDNADVVFIGKVDSIETISKTVGISPNQFETYINKVNFQVSKIIKGTKTDTIQIITQQNPATCGFNFEEGKNYIVYSNLDDNNELNVSLCSRTSLLENATKDLVILNIEGTKNIPQNNEKTNIPVSNSGIVTINKETEKINNGQIMNIEKQKSVYIGTTVGIFAIVLMVFCMVSMTKKND